MKLQNYISKDPHKQTFIDQSISGSAGGDEKDEVYYCSAKIPSTTLEKTALKVMGLLEKGNLAGYRISRTITKREMKKDFRFQIDVGMGSIRYWIADEGGRGAFLNAAWNPNKVLSGQNVFKTEGKATLCDIEFELLPADVLEFPFRLFYSLMNKEFADAEGIGRWEGKATLRKQIKDGELFWRELHITTYSGEFKSVEDLQLFTRVLVAMGSMCKIIGIQKEDPREFLELSMRQFACAQFSSESVEGKDGKTFETVNFVRCKSRTENRKVYRVVMYDKSREVKATNDPGNKTTLETNVDAGVDKRIRIELQLGPSALDEVSAFHKITTRGVELLPGEKLTRVKFLRRAFPNQEVFDRKKAELLVAAMRDLHFDWLVFPRSPQEFFVRYKDRMGESIGIVLEAWKLMQSKTLPGKNSARSIDAFRKNRMSKDTINEAYSELRASGLDVTRISYMEALALWSNLVSATLTREEYVKIEEEEEAVSHARKLNYSTRRTIMSQARARALEIRKEARSQLSSSVVSRNLLGFVYTTET